MRISDWSSDVCSSDLSKTVLASAWWAGGSQAPCGSLTPGARYPSAVDGGQDLAKQRIGMRRVEPAHNHHHAALGLDPGKRTACANTEKAGLGDAGKDTPALVQPAQEEIGRAHV